jgi:hypothetical protein
VAYLVFVFFLGENPFHIYRVLLNERHQTAQEFLADRFGV